MNELSINEQYKSITNLLKQKRLKEAQIQAEVFVTQTTDWVLSNRLEQNKTSYHYMLEYMQQGLNDPKRPTMYRQLYADLWEITDRARIVALDKTSSRYYHELRRGKTYVQDIPSLETRLHTLEDIAENIALYKLSTQGISMPDELRRQHEAISKQTFLDVWTSDFWTAEEMYQANMWLKSDTVPRNDLCLMISAVGMSLLEYFDPLKMQWLLQASIAHDNIPRQRALVGITLALLQYPDRVMLYPQLEETISLYDDEYQLGYRMNVILVQLLRSQNTERINRKMQEEIIPEVMKNKDLIRRMRFGLDEEEDDANPDWIEAIDQMGLNKKIQEMNELQLEGNDIYMSTFSLLKGYPFFQELPNWFMPFDKEHSSISPEFRQGMRPLQPIFFVFEAGLFCDSDKYSMAFMLQQLPSSQRNMMLSQMTHESIEELNDEQRLRHLRQYSIKPEVISNQYIQDLYRFFKLNRRKEEFIDPFKEPMNFYESHIMQRLVGKPELMQDIPDLLFREERWKEALPLYEQLTTVKQPDAELFQKIGFCQQKLKHYEQAIEAYQKADILKPNHVWTIRHIATCHRLLGQYEKALEEYRHAETIQPENHTLSYHIGTCLAALKCYEEALQYFFKADLIEENNHKIWRAIGWCSLLAGRWGQAAKYYARIPDTDKTAEDFLNAGHIAFVSEDFPTAVKNYRYANTKYGNQSRFREAFEKDHDTLLQLGIDANDLPLMEDLAM